MPRYVAFLRGVSPMNAKMPALKRCFESVGFTEVRTLLSSGNVVFDARTSSTTALERRAEKAMLGALGRSFDTFVRTARHLQAFVEGDPFGAYELPPAAKRVVTFLRQPAEPMPKLPLGLHGARILGISGLEVLAVYVPGPEGPAFMTLLERTFGKVITTRTLDTVRKCAWA